MWFFKIRTIHVIKFNDLENNINYDYLRVFMYLKQYSRWNEHSFVELDGFINVNAHWKLFPLCSFPYFQTFLTYILKSLLKQDMLKGCNCRIEFSLILTYHKEYFRHRGILARICCTSFLNSMASKCYFKKAKSNSLPNVRYSHLAWQCAVKD